MRKIRTFLQSLALKKKATNKGELAELAARRFLQKQKLTILEQNFFCKLGEIDLICLENGVIVFVEVRYRKDNSHGNAAQSIHHGKQRKVIKSAQYWLLINHKHDVDIRFDAILFDQSIDEKHLTWLKSAF
ncbi:MULTISPECIES: YraN family protein [unclassified Marinomonas]|jgi:putative endonuclease|uniref:YraN family protein n=1 Tax=unclassified Marinomonas TaxID=196814 RepID=UPI0005F9AB7E|nr:MULTISPECIES: YraN family protein [unclassified Marinomonas]